MARKAKTAAPVVSADTAIEEMLRTRKCSALVRLTNRPDLIDALNRESLQSATATAGAISDPQFRQMEAAHENGGPIKHFKPLISDWAARMGYKLTPISKGDLIAQYILTWRAARSFGVPAPDCPALLRAIHGHIHDNIMLGIKEGKRSREKKLADRLRADMTSAEWERRKATTQLAWATLTNPTTFVG